MDTSLSTALRVPLPPAPSTWQRFGSLWRSLCGTAPMAPGALEIMGWLMVHKAAKVLSAVSLVWNWAVFLI